METNASVGDQHGSLVLTVARPKGRSTFRVAMSKNARTATLSYFLATATSETPVRRISVVVASVTGTRPFLKDGAIFTTIDVPGTAFGTQAFGINDASRGRGPSHARQLLGHT